MHHRNEVMVLISGRTLCSTDSFPRAIVATKSGKFDFVIGRAGWGIAWNCLIKSIPLLLLPPNKFDDPVIIINYETLMQLNLVLPITTLQSKSLIYELDKLRIRIKAYNKKLIKSFGTISGSEYISKHGMIKKFLV